MKRHVLQTRTAHHPPLMRRLLLPLAAAAASSSHAGVGDRQRQPRRAGRVPGPGRPARGHRREPGLRPLLRRHADRKPPVRHRGQLRDRPFGEEVSPAKLLVRLGNIDRAPAEPDDYLVASYVKAPAYADSPKPTNDAAILTLARVANYEPVRVVDTTETDYRARASSPPSWAGAGSARWRTRHGTSARSTSRSSTTAAAPPRTAPRTSRTLMMCAADPLGTSASTAHDFCEGDEGGPLLVPDGSSTGALAGIASWHGTRRAPTRRPRRLHAADRRRAQPLDPQQDAGGRLRPQPPAARRRAGDADSTSRHPEGAGYFTTFRWDLDNDGAFDDANGRSISHAFPTAGEAVAGLEASKPGGDKASIYYAFDVEPPRRPRRGHPGRADRRAAGPKRPRSPRSSPPSARR